MLLQLELPLDSHGIVRDVFTETFGPGIKILASLSL